MKTDRQWPVLAEEAYYGLPGEIVRAVEPYTESDPVAVLLNILIGYGSLINSSAHAVVEFTQHPCRLFVVQVGESSKGRKGTGWSAPRYLLGQVDENWSKNCIKTGLSSGEGLIYAVRDRLVKREPVRKNGRVVDYQDVEADSGVTDKRLLVIEPEFAQVLQVMGRDGNTISAVIRQAWDDGNLSPLTRNNPITATNAHISIIGHITRHELLTRLTDTSMANGFANRFLWALVRRSKLLPHGAALPDSIAQGLIQKLRDAVQFGRRGLIVMRDRFANSLWEEVYGKLGSGYAGLVEAIVARAEAQVLRLSVIYALMDQSETIQFDHLKAALALWRYCEESALYIFGDKVGHADSDRILSAVRRSGDAGLSDNDVYNLFHKNKSAAERETVLQRLEEMGHICASQEQTGGRPRTVWRAT